MEYALDQLAASGRARRERVWTGGRPADRWMAIGESDPFGGLVADENRRTIRPDVTVSENIAAGRPQTPTSPPARRHRHVMGFRGETKTEDEHTYRDEVPHTSLWSAGVQRRAHERAQRFVSPHYGARREDRRGPDPGSCAAAIATNKVANFARFASSRSWCGSRSPAPGTRRWRGYESLLPTQPA